MPKNYYYILGVGQHASTEEIRRAFRTLAIRCHPDSNPGPNAHEQFVKINEAYQVLTDPLKRSIYDRRLRMKLMDQHRYDARVARPHYRHTYRPSTSRQVDELLWVVPYVRYFSILMLAFALLLGGDFMLREKLSPEVVQSIEVDYGTFGSVKGFVNTRQGSLQMELEQVEKLAPGAVFRQVKTPVLGITTCIEVLEATAQSGSEWTVSKHFIPHYGIYNVFAIFIVMLVVCGLSGLLINKEKTNLLFNIGLLSVLVMVLTLAFTFNS
ncbi:MAG: hypothetical protein D6730_17525 [Bacteroidetes bacterium]|nr:MAG: hypothetical protein D6730_17525 [Bacteroidota bacterium]